MRLAARKACFAGYGGSTKALDRKVMLKIGGYLIIDQTESMITMDVNTGSFIGYHNLEETIYCTNLEAAETIARQLRLRNLGGIIVIDFINMHDVQQLRVLVSQAVVDLLLDEEKGALVEFEKVLNVPIKFQVETSYTQEEYDVVLM